MLGLSRTSVWSQIRRFNIDVERIAGEMPKMS